MRLVDVLLKELRILLNDDFFLHILLKRGLRDHIVVGLRYVDLDN